MIDTFEKATIQDFVFAEALDVNKEEIGKLSLIQMKNEMHQKAFCMRKKKQVISQEEADVLNLRLEEIVNQLVEYGYEPMEDYIIDFNSFVVSNSYYNKFYW